MDLKRDIEHGVFYTAIAKYAGVFITLAVTAILARIFTPEEFGIINIATVFIAFFNTLGDMGIATAIIQKRDLSDDDLRSIFSLTFWVAVVSAGLLLIFARPISEFYGDTGFLRKVLMILSINVFFSTIGMVPNALMLRDRRFKFTAIRTLIVQFLSGILAVAAAISGFGVYALTINPVLSAILLFIINFSQYPIAPKLFPKLESIKKVISYSIFQLGFQLINYFSKNIDKMLMGKYLSMGELGYYDKSYRLIGLPSQYITFVISPVIHPVMAQIQDDKSHMAKSYMQIVKLLAYMGIMISVGMYFMSDNLIYLIFGYQWGKSIAATKILSITIALNMVLSSSGPIFQAAGDTKRLFGCGLFTAVSMVAGVCYGVFVSKTTEGLAWGISIATAMCFMQCYYSLFVKCLKDGWKDFWKTLRGPAMLGIVLIAVLYPSSLLVSKMTERIPALIIYSVLLLVTTGLYGKFTGSFNVVEIIKSIICRLRNKLKPNTQA